MQPVSGGFFARLAAFLSGPRPEPWHMVDHAAFDHAVDTLGGRRRQSLRCLHPARVRRRGPRSRTPGGRLTEPNHVLTAAAEIVAGHQFRFKAGAPGCSCGDLFAEGTGHLTSTLHAVHLAPHLVVCVLRAAAAALRAELPAEEANAAVSVLAGMVRDETPARRKALQQ